MRGICKVSYRPWFIKFQTWVFNKMFRQFSNWRHSLNYECALAFAKTRKSCGVLKWSCFKLKKKVAFFKKQVLFDLPNAYIIYLVLKITFCTWKVQTNGHWIGLKRWKSFLTGGCKVEMSWIVLNVSSLYWTIYWKTFKANFDTDLLWSLIFLIY